MSKNGYVQVATVINNQVLKKREITIDRDIKN